MPNCPASVQLGLTAVTSQKRLEVMLLLFYNCLSYASTVYLGHERNRASAGTLLPWDLKEHQDTNQSVLLTVMEVIYIGNT